MYEARFRTVASGCPNLADPGRVHAARHRAVRLARDQGSSELKEQTV